MDDLRDRKAILRVVNRRREQIFPGHLTELSMQLAPSIDATRHRHRVYPGLWHAPMALRFEPLDGQSGRRPPARIDPRQLAGLCPPVDDEQVAADPAALRLYDAQCGVRSYGRIDCAAATCEHHCARL